MTANKENEHEDVFGKSFALYNKKDIEEFITPFQVRFDGNKVDPKTLFSGKRCLDAGCGNGRGSIFMMQNGAAHVTSVDISETNIASTRKNLSDFGFDGRFTVQQTSLEKLPFAADSFDFVWCNGVLMHAADPDPCLKELARVLRPEGESWIYVYGSGGIYWYTVYEIRDMVRQLDAAYCLNALRLIKYPVRFIAEYMDDWKVPYLRAYTHADFGTRLVDFGFAPSNPLPFGMTYDTSHRRAKFPAEADLFGEGDLRYVLRKEGPVTSGGKPLANGEYGSDYAFPTEKFGRVPQQLKDLAALVADKPLHTVSACAQVQFYLRERMSSEGAFDLARFESDLDDIIAMVKQA